MIKKTILALILLPVMGYAQYGESIRTARPGQAIGAFTLGKNVFQLQNGYNITYLEKVNGSIDGLNEVFNQNTVLRLGLTEHFEISGVINWSTTYQEIGNSSVSVGGVTGTQIGVRYNFTTNEGIIPTIGLQYRALLPLGSKGLSRKDMASRIILSTGNKLSKTINLTTNLIVDVEDFDTEAKIGYIIKTSFSLSRRWSTFIEAFGSFDPFVVNFDTGLAYLVNKDFQLDFSAGYFDNSLSQDYFYDFGLSWRFDWR